MVDFEKVEWLFSVVVDIERVDTSIGEVISILLQDTFERFFFPVGK